MIIIEDLNVIMQNFNENFYEEDFFIKFINYFDKTAIVEYDYEYETFTDNRGYERVICCTKLYINGVFIRKNPDNEDIKFILEEILEQLGEECEMEYV